MSSDPELDELKAELDERLPQESGGPPSPGYVRVWEDGEVVEKTVDEAEFLGLEVIENPDATF